MLLIEDFIFIGALFLMVGAIVALCCRVKLTKVLVCCAAAFYTVLVLAITLCPIPYEQNDFAYAVPHNFVPFKTIFSTLSSGITATAVIQIAGNILISAPFGVIVELWLKPSKYRLLMLCLLPILIPLVIEALQLAVGVLVVGYTYRSFDIDDFILNALGAYLGVAFSKIVLRYLITKLKSKKC